MTDDLKPRTLRDDIASGLRQALGSFRYAGSLREVGDGRGPEKRLQEHHVRLLAEHLTPVVLEIVEHREQLARIDRGILPYDED